MALSKQALHVDVLERETGSTLYRVRLGLERLKGRKNRGTEWNELHYCSDRRDFTSWPKKWKEHVRAEALSTVRTIVAPSQ